LTKILFVCHGNICRSPAAEFVMKELVRRAGLSDEFVIESAATSTEEIGNPVYPPMRRVLHEHRISCGGKTARQIRRSDYEAFDLLIGMDEENLWNMRRVFHGDPDGKLRNLLDYAGRPGEAIADPWYTRDFEQTWRDVLEGCEALLTALTGTVFVDFTACAEIGELYQELREKLHWEDWYAENLDALYDVLTGLPHSGSRFVLCMPLDDAPAEVKLYARRIRRVFADASALAEEG
jgi:protein-tyrosine phosphatase